MESRKSPSRKQLEVLLRKRSLSKPLTSTRGMNGFFPVKPMPWPSWSPQADFTISSQMPPMGQEQLVGRVAQPERRPGLFETLLRDPRVLYHDYLDNPDEYNDEDVQMLTQLVNSRRRVGDLPADQQERLNELSILWAYRSPASKPRSQPKPAARALETVVSDLVHEVPVWDQDKLKLAELRVPDELPDVPDKWWEKG